MYRAGVPCALFCVTTAVCMSLIPCAMPPPQQVRNNLGVALAYMESWLRGVGCVPIHNLMEDAATAEISRTQVSPHACMPAYVTIRHCWLRVGCINDAQLPRLAAGLRHLRAACLHCGVSRRAVLSESMACNRRSLKQPLPCLHPTIANRHRLGGGGRHGTM
jgi:hypothetical protein